MKLLTKAAMIVAAVGLVGASAQAQTVTMRLKPAVGSKFQYKVTMKTTGSGGPGAGMGINGTFNQWFIVKSKNSKGTVVETKVTNAKLTGGGGMDTKALAEAMQKQVITATYSPLGAYLSGDQNDGSMGSMSAQAGLQGVIFPQNAVGVGSKWTATIDLGKLLGSQAQGMKIVSGGKIPVSYKLTGFKMIAGKRIAGIAASTNGKVVMSMGQGGQSMQMTMNLKSTSAGQVDVNTGMVREMTTDATVNMDLGQMKIDQKIKMTMNLM
jgi:hypothetical protein